jgi:DNA-binding beta-propeller fold protein YncE
MKLVATHPTPACNPAGLAVGPQGRLLVGCGAISAGAHAQVHVMDARDGRIIATITQVGATDEVWYNPGDNRYYLAARNMTATGMKGGLLTPVLGVIDASTNQWITNVPTGTGAHSVAVDPTTNRTYVPVPTGIAVFSR